MIIDEAPDHPIRNSAPEGFPICQNFYNDESRDYNYIRTSGMSLAWITILFYLSYREWI